MDMKQLMKRMPQQGEVRWIGVRPAKRERLLACAAVGVTVEDGLEGDHYSGRSRKRQVTLIQEEHLAAVASIMGLEVADPQLTRRNIVVRGINLQALKGRRFCIGSVVLEGTGECHPCSRMEENFGAGGYNAMRGHGGLTAKVVEGGRIALGDAVAYVSDAPGYKDENEDEA